MSEAVHIETSIFSFYHDECSASEIVAMRGWTQKWWELHRNRYDTATSTAVLAELERASLPHRELAHAMASRLPAVAVDENITAIVQVYVEHHVMPRDPLGDALQSMHSLVLQE